MSIELSDQELGERIRGRRIAQGLRQTAFVSPGLSAGYISLIEAGQRRPSPAALDHILSILGLSLEQLLAVTPSVFTAEIKNTLRLAEQAVRSDNPHEAIRLCSELSKVERSSPRVTVVEAEAYFDLGEYDRVIAIAPQATLDLIEDRTWEYARRGMNIFSRATAHLATNVEYLIFMVKIRKMLQAITSPDPLFVLQHAASLSGSLAEMGDVQGAASALGEVEQLAGKVKGYLSKTTLHWAQATVHIAMHRYDDAIENYKKVSEVFDQHGTVQDQRRILLVLANVASEYASADSKIVADVINRAQSTIQNLGSDSDIEAIAALKVHLARLLIKRGEIASASELIDAMVLKHKYSDDDTANINLCRALICVSENDLVGARKHLDSSYQTLHRADVSSSSTETFRSVADVYQQLGDHRRALNILSEAQSRESNLYELLSNELYSS